jgi:hypothetical protein
MSGWTGCDLTAAVGAVVTHRSGHLPKALPAEDLRLLLAVPDRRTMTGSRDFAMLLMLSRPSIAGRSSAGSPPFSQVYPHGRTCTTMGTHARSNDSETGPRAS